MNNLEQEIHKQQWREISLQRDEDEVVEKLFQHQRNALIAEYAGLMRVGTLIEALRKTTEEWNASVSENLRRPIQPLPEPSRKWFSAAILLLTHTDEETQKQFLTLSDDRRAKLVQAVIDDGGIWHDGNYWQEIPE